MVLSCEGKKGLDLGAARGGGVFFTPDGFLETRFAWGLGTDTNNMVEALAIWKGMRITKTHGMYESTILGDSIIIIQYLTENLTPNEPNAPEAAYPQN